MPNHLAEAPVEIIIDSHVRESNPHFKKVEDNQGFIIGEMNFKGIHTPGHFFDSICYQLSPVLFTGDTIFIGRTGRIKGSKSNVEDLYRSVYDKIMKIMNDPSFIVPQEVQKKIDFVFTFSLE